MKARKITLSIILTVLLLVACATNVLAADLTINRTEAGKNYHLYKVLDYSAADGYTISSDFAPYFTAEGMGVSDIMALKTNNDSTALSNFAADLLTYAVANSITPIPVSGAAGSTTVTGLSDGYYLLNPLGGMGPRANFATMFSLNNYIPDDNEDEIEVKAVYPSIDKSMYYIDNNTMHKVDVNTASMGDTINYIVEGFVPDMTGYSDFRYVIEDTMCPGITFQDDVEITIGSHVLTSSDFDVTTGTDGNSNQLIRIIMIDFLDYCSDNAIQGGDPIVLKYTGILNEDALINEANPNTALLKYSNNPTLSYTGTQDHPDDDFGPDDENLYGITPMSTVETFTTALEINKFDGESNVLTGAEFKISGGSLNNVIITRRTFVVDANGSYWKLVDDTYTTTDPATLEDVSSYADTTTKYALEYVSEYKSTPGEERKAFVGEDGKLVFTGLGEGTYTITETTTPQDYNGIDPFEVEISFNTTDKEFSATRDGVGLNLDTAFDAFSIDVVNHFGHLPSTGGIGTTLMCLIGGSIMLAFVVTLVVRKRLSAER